MHPPTLKYDENLRSVPQDAGEVERYISFLREKRPADIGKRVRIEGEIGVYLRILGRLDEAEACLCAALGAIRTEGLGLGIQVQQELRLAHVYQDQRRFEQSNQLFDEIIRTCQSSPEARDFLHFAWQHSGKNLFDQGRYAEALERFEWAMAMRVESGAAQDQVESTQIAIEETKKRIATADSAAEQAAAPNKPQ